MLSDAEDELEREVSSLRAELIRERRARELRAEVANLAAATSAETDRAGVAQVIADGTAEIIDSGWTMVAYVTSDSTVSIKHGPGVPADIAHDWARIPLSTSVPICDVLRGECDTIMLEDRTAFEPWPLMVAEADRAQIGSLFVRKLQTNGHTASVVALAWPETHVMDALERELLELLIRSTGPAFARSGQTEVDGEVARTLQEWVLESRMAEVPDVDIEALYEPGSELLTVGGDWYDVIDLGSGRAAVVVGDVVGHDAKAAVAMSQVRHVLAAHLVAGRDPAEAMELTDTYLRQRTKRLMATAVVMVFEGDGVVTVVSAGHPPPIVDSPGHECAPLDIALGPPLGSGLGSHGSRRTQLPAGSTIVAYTDGVVEERGKSVDDGIHDLIAAVATTTKTAAAAESPIALAIAEMLRKRVTEANRIDDTAAVIMHLRSNRTEAQRLGPNSQPAC